MAMRSWVESANAPECDFPLENLPYGVFAQGSARRIGLAIGDQILDLQGCVSGGLLDELSAETKAACSQESLNALMRLGTAAWSPLRQRLMQILSADAEPLVRERAGQRLVAMRDAAMVVPAPIGDYTDF